MKRSWGWLLCLFGRHDLVHCDIAGCRWRHCMRCRREWSK